MTVFDNLDGTKTIRQFNEPVHYKDSAGIWRDIDTSLVRRPDGSFSVAASPNPVSLAQDAAAAPYETVTLPGAGVLRFTLVRASHSIGKVSSSGVEYDRALPGVNVHVTATVTGAKESLELTDPRAPSVISFGVTTTSLTLHVTPTGAVEIVDRTGATVAKLPAPVAADANGRKIAASWSLLRDRLSISLGRTALRGARYPVAVDPTVIRNITGTGNGAGAMDTYFTNDNLDHSSDVFLAQGLDGANGNKPYVTYVKFAVPALGGVPTNAYVEGATLGVEQYAAGSTCTAEPTNVYNVTQPWAGTDLTSFSYSSPPSAATSTIGTSSFAGVTGNSTCPEGWNSINIGAATVDGWTHGTTANDGLKISAGTDNAANFKRFRSGDCVCNPSGAPYLDVTYSDDGATYAPSSTWVGGAGPTHNSSATINVTVTNHGDTTWSAGSYSLGVHVYNSTDTTEITHYVAATLPSSVAPNASVTLPAVIKALDPGTYYLHWDMQNGSGFFSDGGVSVVSQQIIVSNIPPRIDDMEPLSGTSVQTQRPTLTIYAHDPDAYPGTALKYDFKLYTSSTSALIVDSGWITASTYQVPAANTLSWGTEYYWTAQVDDGYTANNRSAVSANSYFVPRLPQPNTTSLFGGNPQTFGGIVPQTGNYSTTQTDISIGTAGLPLTVTRTYNSQDYRTSSAFGEGWSSQLDAAIQADATGLAPAGSEIVTLPDGQQVGFAYVSGTGASTKYYGPAASKEVLSQDGASPPTFTLTMAGGLQYHFQSNGSIDTISKPGFGSLNFAYDGNGRVATVTNSVSGRALHFFWAQLAGGSWHVNQVDTDSVAANGNQPYVWYYNHDPSYPDWLTQVCQATGSCTGSEDLYNRQPGNHYGTVVYNDNPVYYLRLDTNDGKGINTANNYGFGVWGETATGSAMTSVTASPDQPLASIASAVNLGSAVFNGTSSRVTLNSLGDLSGDVTPTIELWFKTTHPGIIISANSATPPTAPTFANPFLYIGSDNKLHGEFYVTGKAGVPITSANTVTNGAWHHVVLTTSADGTQQTMYLDGTAFNASWTGSLPWNTAHNWFLGTGYINSGWANSPLGASAGWSYFNGQIAEVAEYAHPLGQGEDALHRQQANRVANVLAPTPVPGQQNAYLHSVDFGSGNTAYSDYMTKSLVGEGQQQYSGWTVQGNRTAAWVVSTDATTPAKTYLTYNGNGQLATETFGASAAGSGLPSRSWTYNDGGFVSKVTDENGFAVSTSTDTDGNVLSRTSCRISFLCYTSYYTYCTANTAGTDPSCPAGITPTDPRYDQILTSRDPRSTSTTDPTYQTSYAYDTNGQRTSVSYPATPDFPSGRATHSYFGPTTASGCPSPGVSIEELTAVVDAKGQATCYVYNANGDVATSTDRAGASTQYSYDELGRATRVVSTWQAQTAGSAERDYTYNQSGQTLTETDPAVANSITGVTHQRVLTNSYDNFGRITTATQSDATGGDASRAQSWLYNINGNASLVTESDVTLDASHTARTTYIYNAVGQLTDSSDPNANSSGAYVGNAWHYDYDAQNRRIDVKCTCGGSSPTTTYTSYAYDPAGRLASTTDALGRTTAYTYYNDDLPATTTLRNVVDPDGISHDVVLDEAVYDAAGNVTSDITHGGQTERDASYDAAGRMTSDVTDPAPFGYPVVASTSQTGTITTASGTTTYAGGSQTPAVSLAPDVTRITGAAAQAPAVVMPTAHSLDLVYSDTSSHFQLRQAFDGAYDTSSLQLGTTAFSGAPAAVSKSTNRLVVFGRGTDNNLYRCDVVNTGNNAQSPAVVSGHCWTQITGLPAGDLASAPSATVDRSGAIYVAYSKTDGTVVVAQVGDNAVASPVSVSVPGVVVVGTPGIATGTSGQLGLVVSASAGGTNGAWRLPDGTWPTDTSASGWRVLDTNSSSLHHIGTLADPASDSLSVIDTNGGQPDYSIFRSYLLGTSGSVIDSSSPTSVGTAAALAPGRALSQTLSYDANDNIVDDARTAGGPWPDTTPAVDHHYAYDPEDRLDQTQVGTGSTIVTDTYGLDTRGLPISHTDPDGNQTSYYYDSVGRLTRIVQPSVTVDSFNATTGTETSASGTPTSTLGYDTAGDQTGQTDADGNTSSRTYDAAGRLTSEVAPYYSRPDTGGSSTPTVTIDSYDYDGNPLQRTDALGHRYNYTYDWASRPLTVTEPLLTGQSARGQRANTYDLLHLTSSTDETGAQTSYGYDAADNLTTVTLNERYPGDGHAGQQAVNWTETFGYDQAGQLTASRSPSGTSKFAGYDGAGQVSWSANGLEGTTQYERDAAGTVVRAIDPMHNITRQGLDAASRVTSWTVGGPPDSSGVPGPVSHSGSWTLDAAGNVKTVTNPAAGLIGGVPATTLSYDAANRLSASTVWATTTHSITTSYGYDAQGNLTRRTDGNGNPTFQTYNSLELPESKTAPSTPTYPTLSARTWTTSYDQNGNPVTQQEPGGVTTSAIYDELNRMTGQSGSGADATTASRAFAYDLRGDLTQFAAGSNSESVTYNDSGEPTTFTGGSGSTTNTYTNAALSATLDSSGNTQYTYDSNGDIASVSDPLTGVTANYAYNEDASASGIKYGPARTATAALSFTYDSGGYLTHQLLQTRGLVAASSIYYVYSSEGLVKAEGADDDTGTTTNDTLFGYDGLGRLTSSKQGTNGLLTTYTYDDANNRTSAGTTTYGFDARDNLISESGPFSPGASYSYTARGTQTSSMIGGTTTAQTFDAFGQLASDGTSSYTYDGLGRLAATGTSAFTYGGFRTRPSGDGTSSYTYAGEQLFALRQGGASAFALNNNHQDLIGSFTQSGSAVSSTATYDAWGGVTSTTGPSYSLGFQGQWTDPSSKKTVMNARVYDPRKAGFLSSDTVTDPSVGANATNYAADDPATNADPSGHQNLRPDPPNPLVQLLVGSTAASKAAQKAAMTSLAAQGAGAAAALPALLFIALSIGPSCGGIAYACVSLDSGPGGNITAAPYYLPYPGTGVGFDDTLNPRYCDSYCRSAPPSPKAPGGPQGGGSCYSCTAPSPPVTSIPTAPRPTPISARPPVLTVPRVTLRDPSVQTQPQTFAGRPCDTAARCNTPFAGPSSAVKGAGSSGPEMQDSEPGGVYAVNPVTGLLQKLAAGGDGWMLFARGIARLVRVDTYTPRPDMPTKVTDWSPPTSAAEGGLATEANLARVSRHLESIDALASHPPNAAMVARIQDAIANGRALTTAEQNFMTHELTEAGLMSQGMEPDLAHEVAGQTHPTFANYDPEVIKQYPEYFNSNWRAYWGIP